MRRRFLPFRSIPLLIAGAVAIAACGGDGGNTAAGSVAPVTPAAPAPSASGADPTVASTTEQAAPTTDAPTTAAETSALPSTAAPAGNFSTVVQPILEQHCASCHVGKGPGTSQLRLDTAGDAVRDAKFIGFAATSRYMPPWPAGGASPAFQHDRRLTDDEIAALSEWAQAGAPLDVDPSTALTPIARADETIEQDLVLKGLPYRGSMADVDDYRCQIYDPRLTTTSFLQGMEFLPDRTEVVHHALFFAAPKAARDDAERADAAAPDAGFPCAGLPRLRGQTRQIVSWAPGQAPTKLPADTGIQMEPGDFFVVQIHYHYSAETVRLAPDESSIVLDFAGPDVIAAAGGTLDPVTLSLYLGPAEIPCSTQQSGRLCDRAKAVADLQSRSNLLAGFVADLLLGQCGRKVEDFAGMTNGVATSTCDLPAVPGKIITVWGHMHEIGASYRMTLNPGTPKEKVLLDIPKWDFDWQLNYAPVDDITLMPGDVIRVECTWDRSTNASGAEPRYILWSEGTNDEMCYSQIVTR